MHLADSFAGFVPSCQSHEFLQHLVPLVLPLVLPPVLPLALPLALPVPQPVLPQGLALECGQGFCSGSFFFPCVALRWHLPKHLVGRQPALAEQSAPWAAPYQGLRTTQVPDRRANPIEDHQMEPSTAVGQQEGGQAMAQPSAHQEIHRVEGSLRREAAHQGMVRMSWDPPGRL